MMGTWPDSVDAVIAADRTARAVADRRDRGSGKRRDDGADCSDDRHPGAGRARPRGQPFPGSRIGLVLLIAGIVALGILGSVSAVVVVIALLVMIFLHELGHYLTAKSAGMKVTEFFLGFGPRIWSFRKGETEYGLKAIPAGAYVRIIGMNNLEPVAPEDEPRTYRNKPYWRKMSVASAGSMMHFLMAVVLLFSLFAIYGQRDPDHVWTVGSLSRLGDTQTSPAIAAGLQVGDRIISIDGIPVSTFDSAVDLIQARPGQTIVIAVERDGQTFETTATLNDHNPEGKAVGFLGVGARYPYVNQTVPAAAQDTAVAFKDLTWGTDPCARLVLLAERLVRLRRHAARSTFRKRHGTGAAVARVARAIDRSRRSAPCASPRRRPTPVSPSCLLVPRRHQHLRRHLQPGAAAPARRRPHRDRHLREDPLSQGQAVPGRHGEADAAHLRRRALHGVRLRVVALARPR